MNIFAKFSASAWVLGSEFVGGGSHNFSVERCPDSFVLDDASDSCTCPAGRFELGGDCVACADGTQKPAPGTNKADCAASETATGFTSGLTSNAARTACDACEDGFYRDEDASGGVRLAMASWKRLISV